MRRQHRPSPGLMLRVLAGLLVVLAGWLPAVHAQEAVPPDPCFRRLPLYETYRAFRVDLDAVGGLPEGERGDALDRLWERLVRHRQVPFAVGDSVALLYRGEAAEVVWRGDFNAWGEWDAMGTRLAGTDLWIYEGTLPADARVDYKVVVDGTWTLDPANPLVMWGGGGPNSELRMPAYVSEPATVRRAGPPAGTVTGPFRLSSTVLGYDLQYQVYLPPGYDGLSGLPVLYVTDGHEYAWEPMGSLVTVLDNTIAEGTVAPLLAVFVDARNPDDPGENRRMTELGGSPAYARFLADELVPAIDAAYRTRAEAAARGLLGTSLGGLTAAYVGALRPDVFLNLGVQSPAFWYRPEIYTLYEKPPPEGLRIFMSQGTLSDGDGGRQMKERFDRYGYGYAYVERNEGHSWGQWRSVLPHLLRYLFPGPNPLPSNPTVDCAEER